jgi:GAF domain-containing protein
MNNNESEEKKYLEKAKEIFSELGAKQELEKIESLQGKSKDETIKLYLENNRKLQNLLRVSQSISSILNLDELLTAIVDSAVEISQAERGILFLFDEAEKNLKVDVARSSEKKTISEKDFYISQSVIDEVNNKQQPLLISDAKQDLRFLDKRSIIEFKIHSILCVPMKFRSKFFGLLYVDSRVEKQIFDETDMEALGVLAVQAAISIENANAYRELDGLRKNLEEKISDRTKDLESKMSELETFHDAAVGREFKIMELEEKIKELELIIKGKESK